MTSPATVSVVIPCYNSQAWIAETLRSVIDQQDVSLQIVVVDDGSTDDSVGVAREAGGNAIEIIQQPNAGVSAARNTGTAAARGEFIQYLDADDLLTPGTLQARVSALTETGTDVAYTDWTRWERQSDGSFAEGGTISRTLGPRPDVDLLTDFWWPPGALLYRRSLVDRIGPWKEWLPVIQDARFLLDAALCDGAFVYVHGVGMKYRVHGANSLSRRDGRAFLHDIYANASELQRAWEQVAELDPARRQALVKVYAQLARAYFPLDRARFHLMVGHLRHLDPTFVPEKPAGLRALSRLVGYPAAEHLASWWRGLKGAAQSLGSSRTSTT